MKKYFLLFAIIFISSSFWNSARSDDGTEWTYDPVGLITDVDQLSDNCEWAPNMLKDMIDNSDQTNFHSNPSTDLRQTDEWIQVKLPYAMQNIKFTMSRRRDGSGDYYNNWNQLPNNVDILVSDDGTTWNKVTNVSQPNLTQSSEDDFASYVDLGGEFQYVRFVVRGTVDDNGYFNISEMQIYKAIKADAQTKLKVKLNDLKTATVSFLPGTDPGFYATDPYNALMQAFKDAEALLTGSHSDAEYTAMMETLQNAYTACVNSKNAIHDGYYYIKSAYKAFKDVQPNAIKAMYATASSTLAWGDLDMNLPKYVFHITKQADGNYAIQNLETQEYVKNAGDKLMSTGIAVSTTKTAEQGQYFIELGYGQFRICNTVNMYAYNVDGNNSGKGTSGNVCTENSGQNGESAWFLTEITDESTIAKMKEEGTKYYLAEKLQETATEAETARQKAFDYDILIKNATDGDAACQIMSNAKEPNEGSYANLIDGNTSTFFHSIYSATGPLTAHNLQIDMVTPVEKLFFKYIGRSGDYHDNPNDINVYVTNDDVLGKDVNSADGDWIPVIHLTEGFPSDVSEAKYISPIFKLSSSYRYLRLVMNNTTSAASGRVNSTTHLPFFNLSEFQVYNGTPSTSSEYNLISGMKSACDALEKLIQDSKEKVTNLAATQDDIDAIKAATNTLNDLYVNRDAMDSQMAILLDSAQKVYDNATGNNQKLILDEDQLSTNSSSAGDESSLAHLIDGDLTTIFHSHWDTAMADASTTVDSWDKLQTAWVTNNSDNIAVGTGYHNLQVKLIQPISNFNFTYTGRGDTDYHDNPNDVEIYATNDDNLGANVLASDSSKWTKITELKNGFPENIRFAQYISPNIDLTKPYKYIRFVIKGTTNQNCAGLSRQFVVPDITGITWNVSEFQMYMVLNPERIQYNYIPALKEAIDAMKTLMDADKKLERHSILTTEPIVSLRTAMNKALSLYADSTELSGLYGKYKAYADSSVVGEGIGFVKTQDAINTFRSAINEAKSGVSLTKPTRDMLTTATDAMKNAFTTFMTNVGQIVPNQWYNILSGSDYPYAQNQPIFLGSTSTGAQLKIGGYDLSQIDPNTDPYCIWRFVPIEGKEGQYAIQNLGTGQYFGAYRGKGSDNSPLMSHKKAPYEFQYYGNGKFKLIQAGVADDYNCLKSDGTSFIILNWPANPHSEQAWKFEAIRADQELSFNSMPDNSIQIMTLPFESKGDLSIAKMNDFAQTYAIKSLTVTETGSKLELTKKDDFEAGEPFILMVNDYTKYDASAKKQSVSISVPTSEIDTSTIVANGLVGTLQGLTISKPGLGIFKDSKLSATGTSNLSISGREGYINPNLVTTQEGNTDLTIEIADLLNGVKSIIVNKSTDKVNIYTIDGKLLKHNVKATEAQEGLSKGLYIIGKKKAIVR